MKPAASLTPLSRLTLLVFRAQQAITRDGDRLAAPWGVTAAQWKALGAVSLAEGSATAAAVGRRMGMSRQAAAKQTRILAERGLLERRENPADARAPVYSLTPLGRATLEEIGAAWARRGKTLAKGLDDAGLDGACGVLEGLLDRLEGPPGPPTGWT